MPDDDPNIYHMAGTSLLDKLKQQWDKDIDLPKEELGQKYSLYELDIKLASERFDYSCHYAALITDFLVNWIFCFPIYNLSIAPKYYQYNQSFKAFPSAARLRLSFMETLEEAKTLDELDEPARVRIRDYENRFFSDIAFGNYGKTIEYYQNLVDSFVVHQLIIASEIGRFL